MIKLKIIHILTAIFILNMLCVTATTPGNFIDIADIDKCYGTITLKIIGEQDIIKGEYSIVGCNEVSDNKWNCQCDNVSNIKLNAGDNVSNIYDIKIEYYIEPLVTSNNTNITPSKLDIDNELKRRTYEYNNIIVKPKEIIEEPFKMPKFTDGFKIGAIIGSIIIIFVLMIVGIIYWLFKEEKDEEEFKPQQSKEEKQIDITLSDKEILEQLRNNIK